LTDAIAGAGWVGGESRYALGAAVCAVGLLGLGYRSASRETQASARWYMRGVRTFIDPTALQQHGHWMYDASIVTPMGFVALGDQRPKSESHDGPKLSIAGGSQRTWLIVRNIQHGDVIVILRQTLDVSSRGRETDRARERSRERERESLASQSDFFLLLFLLHILLSVALYWQRFAGMICIVSHAHRTFWRPTLSPLPASPGPTPT
jgi:hypothetical protein